MLNGDIFPLERTYFVASPPRNMGKSNVVLEIVREEADDCFNLIGLKEVRTDVGL